MRALFVRSFGGWTGGLVTGKAYHGTELDSCKSVRLNARDSCLYPLVELQHPAVFSHGPGRTCFLRSIGAWGWRGINKQLMLRLGAEAGPTALLQLAILALGAEGVSQKQKA